MTNNEKFKEVFGVKLVRNTDLCSMVDCEYIPCRKCPLDGNSFEFSKYNKPGTEEAEE